MQPNFSESNSVDWGGDKVNPLQLALGKAASGLIQGIGNLSGEQILATGANAMADLKKATNDPASEAALIAYFAGQAVGANIFGRATGTVLNPNMELLFTGPRLRTFAFNFKMTPRSEPEAREIREIIKTFKKYWHLSDQLQTCSYRHHIFLGLITYIILVVRHKTNTHI